MFSQFNKPCFGVAASNSSFGFANSTSSSQMSISQPFGQPGFATPPQQVAFGAPAKTTDFVTLFDQANPAASPFSQSNFNFGTSSKPFANPFGQKNNSFGPSASFGLPVPAGTVSKYEPVAAVDSVQRSGIATSICTKLHCITCMKEYERKSLEELRWEDYQEGRKQPTAASFALSAKPATFSFDMNAANQQATFSKPASFGSAVVKPFSAPPTQNFFAATTSNNTAPTAQPFRFGNIFGPASKNELFNPVKQTAPSTQPGVFSFAPQAPQAPQAPKPNTSFEASSFKINFPTKSPPFGAFLPTTNQQPATQTFQNRFTGTPNPPLVPKPVFGFTAQTAPPPRQSELQTGFESQRHDFHQTVQQIFQPFPRREFLKAPKRSTQQSPDQKTSKEFVERLVAPQGPSRLHVSPKPRRYALLDDLAHETPRPICGRRATGRYLMFGKAKRESERADKVLASKYLDLSDSDTDMESQKPVEALVLKNRTFRVEWEQEYEFCPSPNSSKWSLRLRKNNRAPEFKLVEREKTVFTRGIQFGASQMNTIGTQTAEAVVSEQEHVDHGIESPSPEDSTNPLQTSQAKYNLMADGDCRPSNPVKLERPDYYTVPPLNTLYKYQDDSGRCLVKDFKVGRVGYGEIHFLDEIDVSNLDLDEIVDFQYREVTVYPDEARKPPVGQGLNRRAQVTLDQIWPLDKKHDRRLKNPHDLAEVGFAERLSLLSERQNAKFVDYRPETGSWVFTVEHFSKFHFDDSDDADVEEMQRKTPTVPCETGDGRAVLCKRDRNDSTEQTALLKKQKTVNEVQVGGSGEGCSETPLDCTIKTIARRTAFTPNTAIMKSFLFDDINKPNEQHSHRHEPIAIKDKRKYKATIRHFPLLNHHETPKSLLTTRNYADAAVLRARSFKVGWGHGFKFITSTNTAKLTVHRLEIKQNTPAAIEKQMEICFKTSTITHDYRAAPLCAVNSGWEPLLNHQSASTGLDKQIWDLCLAFWGPLANTPVARRELFNKWLQDAACPYVQTDLKPHSFSNLFAYLSGHEIESAERTAMDLGLPRLATLVSSSRQSVRELISCQLQQWQDIGAINFINRDFLKLYMLLGGIPVLSDVNICEDLDWQRALAIHLWYICPSGVSLIHSIEAYQNGFANYAKPPYVNHSNHSNSIYDIRFHIMLLYAQQSTPIDKALDPLTHTDEPLDYRMSWLLLQVLTALKVGIVPPHVANSLHVGFASQLEGMGLWKWAIFVVSALKDASAKTHMIMGILERNLDLDRTCKHNLAVEDSLVNDFKIPRSWIHAVLAEKAGAYQRHAETFGHLLCAGEWFKAHAVAVSHLLPNWMLARRYDHLLVLFDNLALAENDISGWNHGGGVVLDVLSLHLKGGCDCCCINVTQMKAKVRSLCPRMKHLPSASPTQTWAAAELSKLAASLLRSFYGNSQPCAVSDVQSFLADVFLLPMAPECKSMELHNASRYLAA